MDKALTDQLAKAEARYKKYGKEWSQLLLDSAPAPLKTRFCPSTVKFGRKAFLLEDEIGEGTQGNIFIGLNKITRRRAVVKIVKHPTDDAFLRVCGDASHEAFMESEKRELRRNPERRAYERHLPSVKHKNVLYLQAVFGGEREIYNSVFGGALFYEYCTGRDLHDFIWDFKERHTVVPEGFIWHVYAQLSSAVAFIHGYRQTVSKFNPETHTHEKMQSEGALIHCDIRPANIFMQWKRDDLEQRLYPDIQLADFGLSWYLKPPKGRTVDEMYRERESCAPATAPPEWCNDSIQSTRFDSWSVGATIHALCHDGLMPLNLPFYTTHEKLIEQLRREKARKLYYANALKEARAKGLMERPEESSEESAPKRKRGRPTKIKATRPKAEEPEPRGWTGQYIPTAAEMEWPDSMLPLGNETHHDGRPYYPDDYNIARYGDGDREQARKFHSLPYCYSEQLDKLLRWNLNLDLLQRPSSKDLYRIVHTHSDTHIKTKFRSLPPWFQRGARARFTREERAREPSPNIIRAPGEGEEGLPAEERGKLRLFGDDEKGEKNEEVARKYREPTPDPIVGADTVVESIEKDTEEEEATTEVILADQAQAQGHGPGTLKAKGKSKK